MVFKDFLFNTLPDYYYINDSNKDGNNEGTLQRYLSVLGLELDDEIVPALENFINEMDAETASNDLLNYISDSLGNPPDIFLDEEKYRLILKFIINVYKIKGTKKSYELFFSMLGFNINITEFAPLEKKLYDELLLNYDEDGINYDMGCETCSEYEILFTSSTNPLSPLDQTTLSKLRSIVPFVEPINADLRGLVFGISITEDVNFCIEQEVKFTALETKSYDNPIYAYDQIGLKYDNTTVTNLLTLPIDCAGGLPLEGISIWGVDDDFIIQ